MKKKRRGERREKLSLRERRGREEGLLMPLASFSGIGNQRLRLPTRKLRIPFKSFSQSQRLSLSLSLSLFLSHRFASNSLLLTLSSGSSDLERFFSCINYFQLREKIRYSSGFNSYLSFITFVFRYFSLGKCVH